MMFYHGTDNYQYNKKISNDWVIIKILTSGFDILFQIHFIYTFECIFLSLDRIILLRKMYFLLNFLVSKLSCASHINKKLRPIIHKRNTLIIMSIFTFSRFYNLRGPIRKEQYSKGLLM